MKRIVWTEPAKADVRRLDKPTAMRILAALHRFVEFGEGDVKALQGREELRLRIGDYRLFFVCPAADITRFTASFTAAKPTVEFSIQQVNRERRPALYSARSGVTCPLPHPVPKAPLFRRSPALPLNQPSTGPQTAASEAATMVERLPGVHLRNG